MGMVQGISWTTRLLVCMQGHAKELKYTWKAFKLSSMRYDIYSRFRHMEACTFSKIFKMSDQTHSEATAMCVRKKSWYFHRNFLGTFMYEWLDMLPGKEITRQSKNQWHLTRSKTMPSTTSGKNFSSEISMWFRIAFGSTSPRLDSQIERWLYQMTGCLPLFGIYFEP